MLNKTKSYLGSNKHFKLIFFQLNLVAFKVVFNMKIFVWEMCLHKELFEQHGQIVCQNNCV